MKTVEIWMQVRHARKGRSCPYQGPHLERTKILDKVIHLNRHRGSDKGLTCKEGKNIALIRDTRTPKERITGVKRMKDKVNGENKWKPRQNVVSTSVALQEVHM
jgi:hypothetical protein